MKRIAIIPATFALMVTVTVCTDTPTTPDLPDGMTPSASRITRGDVESGIHGFVTGGFVLLFNANERAFEVAAVGKIAAARIVPFINGQRKCVLDWHAIATIVIAGLTREETVAFRDAFTFDFILNGVSLELVVSPVKAIGTSLGTDFAWTISSPAIAPDELGVGTHELTFRSFLDGEPISDVDITFDIDPPDAATCTG